MNDYWAPGMKPITPKSRLQIAKDARDRALQDLAAAAKNFKAACDRVTEAEQAAKRPCSCEPRNCNVCGGTK